MAKNKGFKFNEAKHKKESLQAMAITEQWLKQAALDAYLITQGYGTCMGKDPWGAARLVRGGVEFIENLCMVCDGLQYTPDADAVRVKVDRLLKDKLPEEICREWSYRYIHWIENDLETEAKKKRREWIKGGMDAKNDGGTSELLRGVSDEAK